MALVLYSLLRRHMKHTGRYFEPGGTSEAPNWSGARPEESVVGWYQNPVPWQDCWLVFTDKAIYSLDHGSVMRLSISDILDYEFPKSKSDPGGVRVRTPDGFRFLRATGSFGPDGNQKDAFSLIQVLRALAGRNLRQ